jgi:ferredoxin
MVKLGRKGIPVGCLNGGCGVCKVRVLKGSVEATGPISRAHVSQEESDAHITLACRAAPTSDLELEILGKMKKSFLAQCGKP